jgi:pimeloyl-ACP methyl ester carboxylesterase
VTNPAPELVKLPDGRQIEFTRYGAPTGPTAIFFHGFLGSYHQASFAHEAALHHGLSIVAPNRPFVGSSSPSQRRAIADHVPDVEALVNALGIERFSVMGVSGGAPYALACLAKLPHRCRVGILVSGLGPLGEPEVLGQMNSFTRRLMLLGRRFPWLLRGLIGVQKRRVVADPEEVLTQLIRRWSRTDSDVFRHPAVREILLADLKQVFLHGQPEQGLSQELQLYFRWGFELSEAAGARVLLWHGRNDVLVPADMSRHAVERLPGSELTLKPGGHFMVIGHADEVVRRTREAMAD